jgi:hypothetical protein
MQIFLFMLADIQGGFANVLDRAQGGEDKEETLRELVALANASTLLLMLNGHAIIRAHQLGPCVGRDGAWMPIHKLISGLKMHELQSSVHFALVQNRGDLDAVLHLVGDLSRKSEPGKKLNIEAYVVTERGCNPLQPSSANSNAS